MSVYRFCQEHDLGRMDFEVAVQSEGKGIKAQKMICQASSQHAVKLHVHGCCAIETNNDFLAAVFFWPRERAKSWQFVAVVSCWQLSVACRMLKGPPKLPYGHRPLPPGTFAPRISRGEKEIIVVAWGVEEWYYATNGPCYGHRQRTSFQGKDVVPRALHQAFLCERPFRTGGDGRGRASGEALLMQWDVRGIWSSDPAHQKKNDAEQLIWTAECRECLRLVMHAITGWMKMGTGKLLVVSLVCFLDAFTLCFLLLMQSPELDNPQLE